MLSSPLAQHIAQFANKDYSLTAQSIKCPHFLVRRADNRRLYCQSSPTLALKTSAILALGTTVSDLLKCTNPAASNIWDSQGCFDEEVFEALFLYYGTHVNVHGNKVLAITRQGFNDFLESKRQRNRNACLSVACRVLKIIPVSWQRITSGSLDELFSVFADTKDEDGVPAITKTTLREFYTNPCGALRRRMTHE